MTATQANDIGFLHDRDLLVIDDDDELRRMISVMLKPTLARVSQAASGVEAERMLGASAFDLVVLDWNLMDMSAGEFLERAERTRPGVSARCLVMTGDLIRGGDSHEAERRGLPLLRKPFRPGDLIAALRRMPRG
jgi:DNA-binding response OmpR family regulator